MDSNYRINLGKSSHTIYHRDGNVGVDVPSKPPFEILHTEKKKILYLHIENSSSIKIPRRFTGIKAINYWGYYDEGTIGLPTIVACNAFWIGRCEHYFISTNSNTERQDTLMLPTGNLAAPLYCASFENVEGKIDQNIIKFTTADGASINLRGTFIFELEIGREL
jgi:hypothetical protein